VHVFGLTGGIGSGKSTVARHWRSRGLAVVDADELARLAVAPEGPVLGRIVEHFGSGVLLPTGELDRGALAALVFNDSQARQTLNDLVHPEVRRLAEDRFAALADQQVPLACYEVPLLFETGQADRYRPVVVVSATEATRIARTMARDGASAEAVRARIASQLPLADKAAAADYVIDNEGSVQETQASADRVLKAICAQLGVSTPPYPGLD